MKTLKLFIAVLAIALNINTANAQITKAEVQVSGLTCSLCSKATEKALFGLNFVGDIKVDLNRNVFVLTFKKDMPVNFDQISKKVQGAGFSINSLKATFDFDKVKVINSYFNYAGDTYRVVNGTNPTMTGPVALTVVDKGFAPANVVKKYAVTTPDNAGKTGRVYHVAI